MAWTKTFAHRKLIMPGGRIQINHSLLIFIVLTVLCVVWIWRARRRAMQVPLLREARPGWARYIAFWIYMWQWHVVTLTLQPHTQYASKYQRRTSNTFSKHRLPPNTLMQLIYSHQNHPNTFRYWTEKLSSQLDLYSGQVICTYAYGYGVHSLRIYVYCWVFSVALVGRGYENVCLKPTRDTLCT